MCIRDRAEALEKWPIELFSRLLPRVYQIIEEINRRFIIEVQNRYPGNYETVSYTHLCPFVRSTALYWEKLGFAERKTISIM